MACESIECLTVACGPKCLFAIHINCWSKCVEEYLCLVDQGVLNCTFVDQDVLSSICILWIKVCWTVLVACGSRCVEQCLWPLGLRVFYITYVPLIKVFWGVLVATRYVELYLWPLDQGVLSSTCVLWIKVCWAVLVTCGSKCWAVLVACRSMCVLY